MLNKEKTILIAEDEKSINRLSKAKLKQEGFQVIQAYDGKEALELSFNGDIDLAVLNMMMPYLDGGQVLKRIRAAGISIPVIVFSIKNRESDLRQCLLLGANDYLIKPFQLNDLVARINRLLEEN